MKELNEFWKVVEPGETGNAYSMFNPMSKDWLVFSPDNTPQPWVMKTKGQVSKFLQALNHYNKTKQKKSFKSNPTILVKFSSINGEL